MENKQPMAQDIMPGSVPDPIGSAQVTSQPVTQASDRSRAGYLRRYVRVGVMAALLLLALVGGVYAYVTRESRQPGTAVNSAQVASSFTIQDIPLGELTSSGSLGLSTSQLLSINGQLRVSDGLVLAPAVQPQDGTVGQIYFDENGNTLAYYDGNKFVAVAASDEVDALRAELQRVQASIPQVPAFPSIPSIPTDLARLNSNNVFTGVNTFGNISSNDLAISGAASLQGSLTVSGSTALGSTSIASLLLGTSLEVNSGGTGVSSLPLNGVVIGQGTSPLATVSASGVGMCLMSTGGAPAFQPCPGGGLGVNELNGLNGSLALANATASGATITIDDASTSVKGIARFNADNFSVAAGVVTTIQNISTASTPTFNGLSLSTALSVASGGTGVSSLPSNGVLIGNGTGAVGGITASGTGLCLMSTAGAPAFTACPGSGGVASLNGLSGALSINNTSATGSTITINDASTSAKGIASFNATNFLVSGGAVNVVQNINTAAAPTFAGLTINGTVNGQTISDSANFTGSLAIAGALNANTITPTGAMLVGAAGQSLTLQGSASTSLSATASGVTNALVFATPLGTNKTITLPNASGTVAVSASGPLALDANGNISCATCAAVGAGSVVDSLNGLTGAITLSNATGSGSTITINDASTSAKGIASFNGANFVVSGGVVNTAQDIAATAAPTFAGLTVNGTLATNMITPTGAMMIGATTQSLTLQGNASTVLSATNGVNVTTLAFQAPTANVTYRLQAAAAGTYDVCTSAGNCIGADGGVTTTGGTPGAIARFNGAQTLVDSLLSESGSTVTVNGSLAVNSITPTAAMSIGVTGQSLVLQGDGSTRLSASLGGVTNSLLFAAPAGSNKSITLPNASGTVVVSASGPLAIDANGNVTCATCVTSGGTGGGASAVDSLNGMTGALVIADTTTSGSTITINDASTSVKGIARFDAANFNVTSGTVNTVQDISVSSAPTFAALTLTTPLSVASGGTGTSSLSVDGVIVGNGTGALSSVTAGGAGLCLVSTAGAPSFQACPGAGGVTSLNGLNGSLTVNNATAAGSTITIDDASATAKGIASFNATNFLVSGGAVNTVQDINVTAAPTFGGLTVNGTLNVNTIASSAALTVGSGAQSFSLQGSAGSTISATSGAHTALISFQAPTANTNYRFAAAAAGTYDICTTVGNCVGAGGGAVGGSGTANTIAMFNGSGYTIADSMLTQNADGTVLTASGSLTATGTVTFSGLSSAGIVHTDASGVLTTSLVTDADLQGGTYSSITGVGALSAGSITAGFGTISTNSDITTSATVSAGLLRVDNGASATSAFLVQNGGLTLVDIQSNGGALFRPATSLTSSFQLQNSSGIDIFRVNASNGSVQLGTSNSLAGQLAFADSGSSNIITLQGATATAHRTITLPNLSGTVCLDTGNCSATGSYIQNQIVAQQATSNFWISGVGRIDTALQAPVVDSVTPGANLYLGGDNAAFVWAQDHVVLASEKHLWLVGGATGTRPASPAEGMVYFDTTTKQLIVYANGKWQADRSSSTVIVAANNSKNKDAADFVVSAADEAAGNADAAIQAAINSLPTGGGSVYLMEGTYTVDTGITIPSNTAIAGAGRGQTILRLANSISGSINLLDMSSTAAKANIKISDLQLVGNKANQTTGTHRGMYVYRVGAGSGSTATSGITVRDVEIKDFLTNGYEDSDSANGLVENLVSRNNNGMGVRTASNLMTFSNIESSGNTSHGINVDSSNGITVSGAQAIGNGGAGIRFTSTSSDYATVTGSVFRSNTDAGISLTYPFALKISNNQITSNGSHGINSSSATGVFSRNGYVITNNTINNNTGNGINIHRSGAYATINGNRIFSNTEIGIYLGGYASADHPVNTTVTGNFVYSNASGGIGLSQATNNTIEANTISNNGGATTNAGIRLAGSYSTGNSIIGNTIVDDSCTTSCVALEIAGGTDSYVSNNTLGGGQLIDNGIRTVLANQTDANGNTLNRGNAAFSINTTSSAASLSLQGGMTSIQLPTPSQPTVARTGTSGSVTYGYRVTALDGTGETLPSPERTFTSANATLSATNYLTVSWSQVPGAVQYRIYRTTSNGTPATTGLIGTVAAGSSLSFSDTGLAASGAVPVTNTTGGATIAGALQGTSATLTDGLTVRTDVATDDQLVIRIAGGGVSRFTGTLTVADLTANRTWTLPDASGTICLDSGNCVASGSYIENQIAAVQASANFWIQGIGRVGTLLQAPALDRAQAGDLNIGNSNATGINVGTSDYDRTINVGTGLATQTVTIGSRSAASSLVLQAGSGNISLGVGANDSALFGSAQISLLQRTVVASDGASAFVVQNSAGTQTALSVNTTTQKVTVQNLEASATLAVNNTAATNKLTINDYGTGSHSAAQVYINTGAAGGTGLVIQGASGQSVDNLVVKNSAGATIMAVASDGNIRTASGVITTSAGQFGTGATTGTNSGIVTYSSGATSGAGFKSGDVTLRTGNGTGGATSGNVTIDSGTGSTTGVVRIGTTSASGVEIGRQGVETSFYGNTWFSGDTNTFRNTTNSTAAFTIMDASSAAVLTVDTIDRTVTIRNLVVTGTITLGGHIISNAASTSIAAGTAACTAPTVSVAGNDVAGTITVTTGTGCVTPGAMATVSWGAAYLPNPTITLTPATADAATLPTYVDSPSGGVGSFVVNTTAIPSASTTYKWHYQVIQ